MAVILEDMNLPYSCRECPFVTKEPSMDRTMELLFCTRTRRFVWSHIDDRADDCPIKGAEPVRLKYTHRDDKEIMALYGDTCKKIAFNYAKQELCKLLLEDPTTTITQKEQPEYNCIDIIIKTTYYKEIK